MNITSDFLEGVREEIRQEFSLWNPELLMDDNWEWTIPLDSGLSVRVHSHKSNKHYNMSSYVTTVGDVESEESIVRQVLSETFEKELPVSEIQYMTDLDGMSTNFHVLFDDLIDSTVQVEVFLPWGSDPIVVNVPEDVENKEMYAEQVVEKLVQTDLKTAISEVSGEKPFDVEPSARL